MKKNEVRVFVDIAELMTMDGVVQKQGRKILSKDLGLIKNAAMVVRGDEILWVGPKGQIPKSYKNEKKISCLGQYVFPGFVDCHTHLVFAGDRKNEFELRNQGVSYQQIAKDGGGILATVQATRKSSAQELLKLSQQRVHRHLAQGVTTVEIKSGYGLDTKTEEKILKVAGRLTHIRVVTTFLGAHGIPTEFKNENEYLTKLKKDLLVIKKKNLSQRVDIFIEKSYFSINAAKDYLTYAQGLGFDITIHADQLTRTEAARLAVELKALSADHVICLNESDKSLLASSQTVAVLLPAADLYLDCPYPDARGLIDQGACVALASDFNPGSSPTQNISLVGFLARLKMKMSLPEVFSALTLGGAFALGKQKNTGALLPGYKADFFISEQNNQEWFYDLGDFKTLATFVGGKMVYQKNNALFKKKK